MLRIRFLAVVFLACIAANSARSEDPPKPDKAGPDEVYIPYKNLREVIERKGQGVFLPWAEFEKLWTAAHREALPTAAGAPVQAVIARAAYTGRVEDEAAAITADVEFEVLSDDWTTLDLRLGDVALRNAWYRTAAGRNIDPATTQPAVGGAKTGADAPLIHVESGGHKLVVKGRGRYVVALDFLKKLEQQPGQSKLSFDPVAAPISTIDITLPLAGAEVKIEPLLAASTQPATGDDKQTRVQAFVAPVDRLSLSWAAKAELAAGMAGVLEVEQRHSVGVQPSRVVDRVTLDCTVRHVARDQYTVRLPTGWRVLGVSAEHIGSWSVEDGQVESILKIRLYEPKQGLQSFQLELEMAAGTGEWTFSMPVLRVDEATQQRGLIGIAHAEGLRLDVQDAQAGAPGANVPEQVVQMDPGELPEPMRAGVWWAGRFSTDQAALTIGVKVIEPRITLKSQQLATIDDLAMRLTVVLKYAVQDAGIFSVNLQWPVGWQVLEVGPDDLVDQHVLSPPEAETSATQSLAITLRRKVTGPVRLTIRGQRTRTPDADQETLTFVDAADLLRGGYDGAVIVAAKDHLEATVKGESSLRAKPLTELDSRYELIAAEGADAPRLMGFEFRDRHRLPGGTAAAPPLSVTLALERKKTRITARVSTRIDITEARTRFHAAIVYSVQYSDIEEVRFKVPAGLTKDMLTITGDNIREKSETEAPKPEGEPAPADPKNGQPGNPASQPAGDGSETDWRHWLVRLARPARGDIRIDLKWDLPREAVNSQLSALSQSKSGQAGSTQPAIAPGAAAIVIPQIYPVGTLDHFDGQLVVAKDDNFQIEDVQLDGLRPIDVSEVRLGEHRQGANLSLAWDRPPFALSLSATRQEFHTVVDIVADRVLIEQVASREGGITTRAVFALQAGATASDLKLTLPSGARLLSNAWVNGITVVPQQPAGNASIVLIPLPAGAEGSQSALVELMYTEPAGGGSYAAPVLQKETPVQETRWLLWVPPEWEPIWHDSSLIPMDLDWIGALYAGGGQARSQGGWVGGGQSLRGSLTADGTPLLFRKLGPLTTLDVTLMSRTWWRVWANVFWIALALIGLRLPWRRRATLVLVMLILGALVAAAQPLFIRQLIDHGYWGLAVLAIAWLGQWLITHGGKALRLGGEKRNDEPPDDAWDEVPDGGGDDDHEDDGSEGGGGGDGVGGGDGGGRPHGDDGGSGGVSDKPAPGSAAPPNTAPGHKSQDHAAPKNPPDAQNDKSKGGKKGGKGNAK